MIPDILPSFAEELSVRVKQVALNGKLGALDRKTGEILIEKDQPEAGKHIILLHELLHYAAELLIQNGVIKRQPDERFIEHVAPIVLTLLVNAGLYVGISKEELGSFAQEQAHDA